MEFGLSIKTEQEIKSVLSQFKEIEKAIVFGSRAMGNYAAGSDIDLALEGDQLDNRLVLEIKSRLEDTYIPYYCDVLAINTLKNQNLMLHIQQFGKIFYTS